MKIETQFTEDHQARLTVEVEDERLEKMKHRAAGKLAKRVKIPGFRPGKAPYPVVQRTVGEGAILEEAIELLIEEIYPQVIKEAEIRPYGPGRLENMPGTEPLKLEFLVPLDAEVTLGDYKSIRKPYELQPVTEQKIEEMLQSLRESQAILEPVERPAQEGDVVTVKINGKTTDEDPLEIVKDDSMPLLVRAEQDQDIDEWPFAGFSRHLIGKSVGDTGSVAHTYPDDFPEQSVQGRRVRYEFSVESVKSRLLPELDDDFAVSTGAFENIEDLRKNMLTSMERQAAETYNQAYDQEIITAAVEQTNYKYSPEMLDDEIHQVMHDLEQRLERQGLDMSIYLKSRSMDEEALHEELKPLAEERLKRSLLIYELGKAEDIQIEREELENEAGNTLNYLHRVLPEKEARRLGQRDIQNNLVTNVLADLMSRKTIERLRDIASGKYVEPEPAQADDQAEPEAEPAEAQAETESTAAAAEPSIQGQEAASDTGEVES